MRLVSDILSDTWDKLLRLMITMESNKQVIWMYSTLNRVLRKSLGCILDHILTLCLIF